MKFSMKSGFGAAMLAAASVAGLSSPQPAAAQLFLTPPDLRPGPIEPNDPLVGLPIPGATPAEYRSNLLWNFRAGLNVAALQCQFSPFLRVVPNYNGILAHHSAELATAYTTLGNYFKRLNGPAKGAKAFDDYSTMTYNGFSTLQAQLGFCQTASNIAKSALLAPKGQLINVALQRMRELRNSLVPQFDQSKAPNNPYAIGLAPLPSLLDQCWDKNDQLKPACAAPGS
ncbi:MAG: hypothetical protein QOH81_2667 [Sphingomonadales bacterium]|jgi:hypothetical protein|nr:hypothetical protein [Sphingomonadales bacterium]